MGFRKVPSLLKSGCSEAVLRVPDRMYCPSNAVGNLLLGPTPLEYRPNAGHLWKNAGLIDSQKQTIG